ncbi:hypothetical protein [Pseudonocardia sp. H11422]|uniref:hypothetical protein n=1 Tax=Pseudonocardia sp. H11422 TaxID=2835866 RepID=UPI001BDBE8E1|nr:hypothetical protein [Pseudonocardia sp. H11422]
MLRRDRPGTVRTRGQRWADARVTTTGAIAYALTAPGQTAAISVFIDPMIADLQVSRAAMSTAYLIGTLAGAGAMPFVGRALDRFGARRVLLAVGALFGAVLVGLSAVAGIVGLSERFGTRGRGVLITMWACSSCLPRS